jgi:hypothetical protein
MVLKEFTSDCWSQLTPF